MYAVVTQTMWLTPFNSPTMVGNAVLKIIWSSEARKHRDHQPDKNEDDRPFVRRGLGVGMRAVGLDGRSFSSGHVVP